MAENEAQVGASAAVPETEAEVRVNRRRIRGVSGRRGQKHQGQKGQGSTTHCETPLIG